LSLRLHGYGSTLPAGAMARYQTDSFGVFEDRNNSYVSDGTSVLRFRAERPECDGHLDRSFYQKPQQQQWPLWGYCLLKLLRPLGYFCLHAAAVVAPGGLAVLIAGPSGSGKSTLTMGLIRAGWKYLSDDAVLLRCQGRTACALSLRRAFYVDASAARAYTDLRLGLAVPDAAGGLRRRLYVEDRYPQRLVAECVPRLLLFPTIVDTECSTLVGLAPVDAINHLLAASGPQLFDRHHMTEHMHVLSTTVRQAPAFQLSAGGDLHSHPHRLASLLEDAWKDQLCRASS
jgi:hypothetical protein